MRIKNSLLQMCLPLLCILLSTLSLLFAGSLVPASAGTLSSTPTGLTAVTASTSQINLTWGNPGGANSRLLFLIERCTGSTCTSFTQIASTTALSYSNTGLSASTAYRYRVRLSDGVGDFSLYSNIASATTSLGGDVSAPIAVGTLSATAASTSQIALIWSASKDNVGVAGYQVRRCMGSGCTSFALIASTVGTGTIFNNTGLAAATTYEYRVRAFDAAGNFGGYSNVASAATKSSSDTTSPSNPAGLVATAVSSSQVGLAWAAATDNIGVAGYQVQSCSGPNCTSFALIASTVGTGTTFTNTGLTPATVFSYRVRAFDAAGNFSGFSSIAYATTKSSGGDTTAPSSTASLVATAASSSQVGLTWSAATDNVGVAGYQVQRCSGSGCTAFALIATTTGTGTTFTNTGLTASTAYSYRVRAFDAAGNFGGYSNSSSATTKSSSDTTPPSAPSGLSAKVASSSQIGLTWNASTDNFGVTGYRVERCTGSGCTSFAQIATTTGTSFTNAGLSASTAYSYRVRANDAAGNLSGYSNTSSATTSASTATNIAVTVTPKRGGLTTAQTLSIKATLTNDSSNKGVSWSSTGGGSFSPTTSTSGTAVTFTPPSSASVVTITATSLADGSKTAQATIGVTDLTGVSTYLNATSRQGFNDHENALKTSGPTAVNSSNFGKLFSCTVDAAVYAQPLWVANLTIGGVRHNVVYVATEHNTVYAFDADSTSCQNVWSGAKSLNPSGQTWVTSGDVSCGDLFPDIGITGTPVIDLNSKTLYVVSKSKTSGGQFNQYLHALDLFTGNEKAAPVTISGSASGNGVGSSGGLMHFDALRNHQRSALLLVNGHVVIGWASHCDNGAYHGWLMSYNASTLAQEAVLNLSPNGIDAGVWMAGSGPAADSNGNIYLASGNGSFDASSGGHDYGDSIIKLGAPSGGTFPVLSYFRSYQQQPPPDGADIDQGSGGVLLPPNTGGTSFLVQSGKDGIIYVTNRASLGGSQSSSNNIIQDLTGKLPGGMYNSPIYWNGHVYFGAQGQAVHSFTQDSNSGILNSTPSSSTNNGFGFPGTTPFVSSESTSNGILWALDNNKYCGGCGPSILHAYDANNLGAELWNSTQGSSGISGNAVKFTLPTVANGKVFVGSLGRLDVFGLLP